MANTSEAITPKRQPPLNHISTSIIIPRSLWRAARMYAAEHDTDLRSTIIAALIAFLGIEITDEDGIDPEDGEGQP